MTPDKYQELALRTWPTDERGDIRHALLGLVGEAGELIELYKKDQYKPGFSWLDCKECGSSADDPFHGEEKYSHVYIPKILDELGGYSYYLRIVAFKDEASFEELLKGYFPAWWAESSIEAVLDNLVLDSINTKIDWPIDQTRMGNILNCTHTFLAALDKLDIPLERVIQSNYAKLNSEPTAHGWKQVDRGDNASKKLDVWVSVKELR